MGAKRLGTGTKGCFWLLSLLAVSAEIVCFVSGYMSEGCYRNKISHFFFINSNQLIMNSKTKRPFEILVQIKVSQMSSYESSLLPHYSWKSSTNLGQHKPECQRLSLRSCYSYCNHLKLWSLFCVAWSAHSEAVWLDTSPPHFQTVFGWDIIMGCTECDV